MGNKEIEVIIKFLLDKGLTVKEIKDLLGDVSSGISIEAFNKLFPQFT